MDEKNDIGVLEVLLERFNKQRLPRLLDLKDKVSSGQTLDDRDIAFMEGVLKDAHHTQPILERHPEYQELTVKIVGLYHEITEKALKNEQQS